MPTHGPFEPTEAQRTHTLLMGSYMNSWELNLDTAINPMKYQDWGFRLARLQKLKERVAAEKSRILKGTPTFIGKAPEIIWPYLKELQPGLEVELNKIWTEPCVATSYLLIQASEDFLEQEKKALESELTKQNITPYDWHQVEQYRKKLLFNHKPLREKKPPDEGLLWYKASALGPTRNPDLDSLYHTGERIPRGIIRKRDETPRYPATGGKRTRFDPETNGRSRSRENHSGSEMFRERYGPSTARKASSQRETPPRPHERAPQRDAQRGAGRHTDRNKKPHYGPDQPSLNSNRESRPATRKQPTASRERPHRSPRRPVERGRDRAYPRRPRDKSAGRRGN